MPTNRDTQENTLQRKRIDYNEMKKIYFSQSSEEERDENEKKIHKLIIDDVKRTLPEAQLFKHPIIQEMMIRILFIWNMRHPASGYVQGINDVVTPFIIVFLQDYCPIDEVVLRAPEQLDHLTEKQCLEVICLPLFLKLKMCLNDNFTM